MTKPYAIFTAFTTTDNVAVMRRKIAKVRAEAKEFQEGVGIPTRRVLKLIPRTEPGKGLGTLIKFSILPR